MTLILTSSVLTLAAAKKVDLENGMAMLDIIIPFFANVTTKYVSPSTADATLLLRITTLMINVFYDAVAPYHPTAVGIYTQHSHRLTEKNNRGKNIATLYGSYHISKFLFPNIEEDFG